MTEIVHNPRDFNGFRLVKTLGTMVAMLVLLGTLLIGTTVATAQANSPASGQPNVSGTAEVGETLTADTSSIADADGLENATFSYQWIRNDGSTDTDIQNATGSNHTLVSDDEGKFIKVQVSFIDDSGNSESLRSTATIAVAAEDTSAPGVPTDLVARSYELGSTSYEQGITLEWTAPSGAVTGYQILRSERPATSGPSAQECTTEMVVHENDTGNNATTYIDTDVAEGTIYHYRVKAINSNGIGQQSYFTGRQFRPHGWWPYGVPGSPRAPRNLVAAQVNDGTDLQGIELTWDAPDGEVTGFQILRRLPEDCEFGFPVHVENTNSTDTKWTDTNVEIGTLYEYHVRAINAVGPGFLNRTDSASARPGSVEVIMIVATGWPKINQGGSDDFSGSLNHLDRDDDPDTVDYTLRGDVTLDTDGSDADECEGDGLGEDLQLNVVDEVSEQFDATFGGMSCRTLGNYTVTLVLSDRDGEEVLSMQLGYEVVGDFWSGIIGVVFRLPTISGTPLVGETLTADTSAISDDDGIENATYAYQWIRSDGNSETDINGATSVSYLVATDDVDSVLKVRVSYTDDEGNDESLTSVATASVVAAVPGVPRSVAVERGGTGELDVSWEAPTSNGGSSITGYKVQWKEAADNWDTPADASSATTTETSHTITGLSLGTEYSVRVIATNSVGVGTASAEENAIAEAQTSQQQVAMLNSPASGAPTIGGTTQAGEIVAADTSPIADADGVANATFSYQWIRNAGASDTDIQGATGSTYTLVPDDEGKTIKVRVSFTDDAGNSESLTSAATGAVEAMPDSYDRPHGLQATAGSGSITLTWQDPDIHESYGYYQILRHRPEQGEAEPLVYVEYASTTDRTLVDSSVEPGVLYVYAVKAVKDPFGYLGPASSPGQVRVPHAISVNSPAGGTPAITGTLQVSETLTADNSGITDTDGLTNPTFSYQWIRNDGSSDTAIQGATGSSYTLVDADADNTVKAQVSFTDDAGNYESLTSASTAAVSAAVPGTPRIPDVQPSGTGQFAVSWQEPVSDGGATVTAYSLQWKESSGSWDTEADVSSTTTTATSHTISRLSLGTEYSVRVFATNSAGDGPASSEETATAVAQTSQQQVVTQNTPATGSPAINGTSEVGQTLSVDISSITDADGLENVAFSYQWVANDETTDTDIQDASGSTYTLASIDEGKTIKVRLSFTDDAGNDETVTSGATAEVETPLTAELQNQPQSHNGSDAFTFRILFSEDVTAGFQALKESSFEISEGTIKRARRVNGRNDLRQFTVVPSSNLDVVIVLAGDRPCEDEGAICTTSLKRLSNSLELSVPGPAPVNAPATGSPTISGTAQVGETLTTDTSSISDEDGLTNVAFGYQWVSSDGNADTDISGGTGSSFALTDSELGKTIKVKVSFTDDAGNDETLTSAPTGLVEARPNSPATGSPSITGTAQVGETLTADTSGISDSDGLSGVTYTYQWLADDEDISGGTSSTYTLEVADEGKTIKVRVSFTDDAGNDESLTSDETVAVVAEGSQSNELPPAPTNLTAVVNGDGSVTLSWDAPNDDSIIGYQILRRRPAEGEDTLLIYQENTGSTATTFTDAEATPGTRHVYRVKAINDAGLSNWSNYVRAEP